MSDLKARYSTYPKKKEKKQVLRQEGSFRKRSFEWLKWQLIQIKDFSFYKPCLEQ